MEARRCHLISYHQERQRSLATLSVTSLEGGVCMGTGGCICVRHSWSPGAETSEFSVGQEGIRDMGGNRAIALASTCIQNQAQMKLHCLTEK